ncbi:MAG: bifunctional alpha,alpha-trehalose-phosphate synthase (UDP-forming)/trehalose-phosphatase [Candidatus Saccharimonadales bacterium]
MARLIIVSNRLPVSVKKVTGKLEFYPSIGGLATGLASYTKHPGTKWIGWPGIASEDLTETDKLAISRGLKKYRCYPVFLTKKQLEDYYNGYSNGILWPLFHGVPIAESVRQNQAKLWLAYKRVNTIFADEVLALSPERSTIWIHDYQLLLVPEILRLQRTRDQIGFFLHIPFPESKPFSKLPESQDLIAGLLGANLIGFHTENYVDNFLDCISANDNWLVEHHKVILPNRVVRVTDFPMGIDYGKYVRANRSVAVKKELLKLRAKYSGRKVILTVDRLDPTKGLVERAEAYREFLVQNPKLRGKVVLVMLAVPSRSEIDEYKRLKSKLETLIKDINKQFGTALWRPIDYMYTSLPFEKVTALYQRANVAFIAPLRDGMNLVAKEFIASKSGKDGVLILSNTAGAAQELTEAILVDPKRPASLVSGLQKALGMPRTELAARLRPMQKHLSEATVQKWAKDFVGSLNYTQTRQLSEKITVQLIQDFNQSKKRLLLLDYDGVLVGFKDDPEKAILPNPVKRSIRLLANMPRTTIVIVSGRRKVDLATWFHGMPVNLSAEHGAFWRETGETRWQKADDTPKTDWRADIKPILDKYTTLTPGAFVEQKSTALVWHYRTAQPYAAQKNLVILKRLLKPLATPLKLLVKQGNMILEIKPANTNKGIAVSKWLKSKPDFILCIGDDYTDEDMFAVLLDTSYSVKVGRGRSLARFRLKNSMEVRTLLNRLSQDQKQ